MNHIDKLLMLARRACQPLIYSALCIIDRDTASGKWIVSPQLWDKNFEYRAIPQDWVDQYDTAEEATEAVEQLYESLNISDPERLVILIDDVGV